MKSGKHTLLRKFSTFAVVVSHSHSAGTLEASAQPTEAATNYQVGL